MLVIVIPKAKDQASAEQILINCTGGYQIEDEVLVVYESGGDIRNFPLVNVHEFKIRN